MSDRVLIVDDSEESIRLFSTLLGKSLFGLQIETAKSGEAALAAVRQGDFDLILLDAVMPGMSGFDVCRALKADPQTSNIPVLMVSGIMVGVESRVSGLQSGADGYVCKPFERDELVAQVNVLLRMKRYEDRLRQQEERLETELAERTAHLRANEEQLRMLFDHSPDAIFVEDHDGIVLDANAAACRLHGMEHAQLMGRSVLDLVPEDMRERVANDFALWRNSSPAPYEGTSRRQDGRVVPVEIRASHILYHNKPALLFHVRDISERKQIEEQRRRTENLESVGVLAGGIAHDFNNLLAGVLGNLSFAKLESTSRETLMEVLGEAERAALRAKALTQQLLTFAKGGAPVRKAGSIRDLLEETARFVLAGSKSAYRLQVHSGLWHAFMDGGQISQVLENIVINADQAMPRGGMIEIAAENFVRDGSHADACMALKPGRFVKVSIRDQGVGISPEIMARIFDPYFTTKEAGSGLGLAVAYSIIAKHEGAIVVSSQPGQGSLFTIYLPATEASPARETKTANQPIRRGAGRILVMDDEEFIRTLVVRMLVALGYEAEAVPDGCAAFERYQAALKEGKRFDAVVLDLTIPGGMGGEETMQHLHEIDPTVVGIVSSGYSLEPIFSSFAQYGFKGGIAKPYDMKSLAAVLADLLGGGK